MARSAGWRSADRWCASPDAPLHAEADVAQFETALINLAVNARDAMDGPGAGAAGRGDLAFDVVFTDVIMPGMRAIELGQEIRHRHPGPPVVPTSGYSHVLAEQGRHGFDLLQKSYSVEAMARVLRAAVRDRGPETAP